MIKSIKVKILTVSILAALILSTPVNTLADGRDICYLKDGTGQLGVEYGYGIAFTNRSNTNTIGSCYVYLRLTSTDIYYGTAMYQRSKTDTENFLSTVSINLPTTERSNFGESTHTTNGTTGNLMVYY